MTVLIEIEEGDHAALSMRTKAALKILFAIFGIIFPAKYKHQVKELQREIFELL